MNDAFKCYSMILVLFVLAGCSSETEPAGEVKTSDGNETSSRHEAQANNESHEKTKQAESSTRNLQGPVGIAPDDPRILIVPALGARGPADRPGNSAESSVQLLEETIAAIKSIGGVVTQDIVSSRLETKVFFSDSKVTDAGLVHLAGLTNLVTLTLDSTKVTDDGLEHLEGLTNLEQLTLTGTDVTDVGLEHLMELNNLELLSLGSTKVTDAGLEHFKSLTNLKTLSLGSTSVTSAGVQKLRSDLPQCAILN